MKFLREPLVQFFFIGMCIYGAYALYGTADEGFAENTIVVDASRIDAARTAVRRPGDQRSDGPARRPILVSRFG